MKTYKITINTWTTTGHTFSDQYFVHAKPSCQDIEILMETTARKRGFNGLDDIESFEAAFREY